MILAASDHTDAIIGGFAIALGSAITVGLPLWWSSRRGRKKLTEQVGAIPPTEDGKKRSLAEELAEFKGEVRERFRSGDERFDRLDRGHEELRDGQVEMTKVLEQATSTLSTLAEMVDELNELHKQPTAPDGAGIEASGTERTTS